MLGMKQLRKRETAKGSCNDVTAMLSPVLNLARYCISPEGKSDAFYASNAGKKNLQEFFFAFSYDLIKRFK